MEISRTFWLPDITDWWRKQEETHSKYADICNLARDIFSIVSQDVGVETSFSHRQDVIGWTQSKTTGGTLHEEVVLRHFTRANNGLLAGDDTVGNANSHDNDMQIMRAAEEKKFH